MRHRLLILLLVFYTLLLIYFSLAQVENPSFRGAQIDKLYHALAYTVLAILLAFTGRWKRNVFLIFLISVAFGLFMEVCQFFVPYRNASITDAMANGLGAIVGAYGGGWLMVRLGRW